MRRRSPMRRSASAAPSHRGGWARALSRPRVSGLQAILDRGERHARPHARCRDRGRGGRGRARSRHRNGASRTHQRSRAHARQARTRRCSRSSKGSTRRNAASETGDVKYHLGAQRRSRAQGWRRDATSSLIPNPSHLEVVNPVLEGVARARQRVPGTRRMRDESSVLPIAMHGDAAFPGEGVVAGDVQSVEPARISHGRNAAHHRQQPGRLHDRSASTADRRTTRAISRRDSRCRSST